MLQFNKINKLIIFLLFTSIILFLSINYNSCFKSPPHGYINGYSSLVYSREFCIEDYKDIIYFKTDYQGARILEDFEIKNFIKIFGDSQVLGLDTKKKSDHYLNNIYPNNNFIIYASPNNGPYEVINSLDLNSQVDEDVILTFNASTDFFRLSKNWSFYQHVPLNIKKANFLSLSPLFYDFYKLIIFYTVHNEVEKLNINRMQNLFLEIKNETFFEDFNIYFKTLDNFARKKILTYEYFFTHPYWIYDVNEDILILNEKVYSKYEDLVFKISKKYPKIRFSKPSIHLKLNELTFDMRHLRSKNFIF